jgi:hypothetical protein
MDLVQVSRPWRLTDIVFDAPVSIEDRFPGELRDTQRLDNLSRNHGTCIEGKLLYVKHKLLRNDYE